jgi:solute:Na+ symporter, SSS family
MVSISLTFFDWAIMFVYFAFIAWIGFYLKKFTKTDDDFFLAGRRNSMWVCGIAFMSANMGSMEVIGYAGQSIKYGLYAAHFYLIGAVPAMLFLGVFMMPFYYHSKIKSIPGYLKVRFNESARVFNAVMFVVNMILVSGIALYLQALIFHTFLGWNWDLSIWLSAAFVALYVTLSGLISAMFTEILQFFLIWAGIMILPILGLVDIGGPGEISKALTEGFKTLWSTSGSPQNNPMYITWGGLVLGLGFAIAFGYWTTDFLIIQRAFSAKDLQSARMTPIIGSYFKLLLGAIVVGTGMIALVLLSNPSSGFNLLVENGKINYDSVMPLLMRRYFTPGLIGVGVTSMVAMFMAGMAGNMSSFNAVWTYDIYHSVINKKASPKKLLSIGRIATVAGIILSYVSIPVRCNHSAGNVLEIYYSQRRIVGNAGRYFCCGRIIYFTRAKIDPGQFRYSGFQRVRCSILYGGKLLACCVGMAYLGWNGNRRKLFYTKQIRRRIDRFCLRPG